MKSFNEFRIHIVDGREAALRLSAISGSKAKVRAR